MNNQQILILDIGSFQIKAYIAEKGNDGQIEIISKNAVKSEGFACGKITSSELLAEMLQQAVSELDYNAAGRVIVGLSGMGIESHFALGTLRIAGSHVSKDDIVQVGTAASLTTSFENTEILHIIPQNYRLDGCVCETKPLGKSGTTLECECSVITVNADELAKLNTIMEMSGLHADEYVSNLYAINGLLRANNEDDYLLLSIGAENTEAVVFEDGKFVRLFSEPIGGMVLTNDIMENVKLDFGHAEMLKRTFNTWNPADFWQKNKIIDCSNENIQDNNVQYDTLYGIIENRVDELVDIMFDKMSLELMDRPIKKLYLTGGCSVVYNFRRAVENKFAMQLLDINFEKIQQKYTQAEHIAGYSIACLLLDNVVCEQEEKRNEVAESRSLFSKIKNVFKF